MALSAPPEPNLPKQLNHQKQIQCRLKIAPDETTESTSKHYSIKSLSREINTESSVLPGPAALKMIETRILATMNMPSSVVYKDHCSFGDG